MQFNMGIAAISLTNASGKSVELPLPATAQNAMGNLLELQHLNGSSEPLLTANVPSGTYTSIQVEASNPSYGCSTLDNGGIHTFDGIPTLPSPTVTLNFPSPIKISGNSMALELHLNVSDTFPLSSCSQQGYDTNTPAQPAFTLTNLTPASPPTNLANGLNPNLLGMIAEVSGGSLTVLSPDGLSWGATVNSSTALQGVSALSDLKAGMPVDMDLAMQADGSSLAARVDVLDANVSNLSLIVGPAIFKSDQAPIIYASTQVVEGSLFARMGSFNVIPVNDSQSTFQIAGPVTNLKSLPFQPTFDSATLVAGQLLAVTTQATTLGYGPTYTPASTITLLPQTIDGTVTSTGSAGGFTTYTVQLASYDAFPTFAVEPGQTTQLNNPSTVVVYADSSTQMVNSAPVAKGSLLRFTGLVFNDNGTLRMDCSSVGKGVAE
jgi:hypothetical protein